VELQPPTPHPFRRPNFPLSTLLLQTNHLEPLQTLNFQSQIFKIYILSVFSYLTLKHPLDGSERVLA